MSTNGNGTTQTTQQLEKLAEIAAVSGSTGQTIEHFLGRVESAAQLLTDVGRELGEVGERDEREATAFAASLRNEMRQLVAKVLARKRHELADLERILGKIEG